MSAVCFVHVLHLVGDLPGTLAEAARVLAPGGLVLTHGVPGRRGGRPATCTRRSAGCGAPSARTSGPTTRQHVVALAADGGPARRGSGGRLPGTPVTPRLAAQRLEDRSLSWMWSVDADRWERLVPPALERIRALPDQDRVRPGPGASVLAFSLTE